MKEWERSSKGIGDCRGGRIGASYRQRPTRASAMLDRRSVMRRVCLWMVFSATIAFLHPTVRAESASGKAEPARWIAPDAVIYVEVSRPGVLLDRLTDPRILDYLK